MLAAYLFFAVLRNNKEFRAYSLTPGCPIRGPAPYDLNQALTLREDSDAGYNSEDEDEDVDLDTDLTDLDDPFALEEPAQTLSSSAPSSSFPDLCSPPFSLGSYLQPLSEAADADAAASYDDSAALKSLSDAPETGKEARRRRKAAKNKEKRRVSRKTAQEELGTKLKGIARKRAAESQRWDARDSFATESLPVNSGGWSGLRLQLEKMHPDIKELLSEHEMEVVEWNGRCNLFSCCTSYADQCL